MRAAARLTAAGCRVFRSSVAGAQSRVSSGSLARSLVGIPMGRGLGSSWESIRKHGREFPALRRSVWLVWRAFRAVS